MGKAGVEADGRGEEADTIRSEDAQAKWFCRIQHELLECRVILFYMKAGAEHDHGAGTAFSQLRDNTRHRGGRRTYNCEGRYYR
jgi:hypothetical protein